MFSDFATFCFIINRSIRFRAMLGILSLTLLSGCSTGLLPSEDDEDVASSSGGTTSSSSTSSSSSSSTSSGGSTTSSGGATSSSSSSSGSTSGGSTSSSSSSGGSTSGGSSSGDPAQVADTELLPAVMRTQLPSTVPIGNGTPPNSAAEVRDLEYWGNPVNEVIGLSKALQWDVTGQGVKIAILDSGIDEDHLDLAANIDVLNSGSVVGGTYDDDSTGSHGTAVAGVAAGVNNGAGTQGVAPGADLLAIKVTNSGSLTLEDQITGLDLARINGADVINLSFGISGFENYDLQQAIDDGVMPQSLIDAYKRGIADDIIYTIAAGNSAGVQPEWGGKFAAYGASNGQVLVVGALNEDGTDIASFSNAAGDAQNYFILAPGENVLTTLNDGGLAIASGTSFAAPYVAGAAALVKSAGPPTLTARDVVAILLSSTDDLGVPGNDPTYGAGRLNIEAALLPQGQTSLALSSDVSGPSVALSAANASATGAFSSALDRSQALSKTLFFDAYQRSYFADLRPNIKSTSALNAEDIAKRLQSRTEQRLLPVSSTASVSLSLASTSRIVGGQRALSTDQIGLSLNQRFSKRVSGQLNLGKSWADSFSASPLGGQSRSIANRRFALLNAHEKSMRQNPLVNLAQGTSFLGQAQTGVGFAIARQNDMGSRLRASFGSTYKQSFGSAQKDTSRRGLALMGYDQKIGPSGTLTLDLGLLRESGNLLGTSLGTAFSTHQAINTEFASLSYQHLIGKRFDLGASYTLGRTNRFSAAKTLLKEFTGGQVDAANLWFGFVGDRNRLQAGVSRELGFRSGSVLLSVPTAVTYEGEGEEAVGTVTFTDERISLKAPSRYGFNVAFSRLLGKDTRLDFLGRFRTAGGIDSKSDIQAGVRFNHEF